MPRKTPANIHKAYTLARDSYAAIGVDTDKAMSALAKIPISLHCWQGDDVGGFEKAGAELGGGIAVTGNYPGKARTPTNCAPTSTRPSPHPRQTPPQPARLYAETGGRKKVDRDALEPAHFQAGSTGPKNGHGLDFNPTCFSHPKPPTASPSPPTKAIRDFWIEHGHRLPPIGAAMGRALGTPCVTNVWIPDGYKDTPVDRKGRANACALARRDLRRAARPAHNLDAVESKLFGIGSESYVVGSHEFYLGYAIKNQQLLCLDAGHFHPTEGIADKISAVLHVRAGDAAARQPRRALGQRPRGDPHDELRAIAQEIVRGDYLDRTHIGLDFFDASINRIAAWVIGTRACSRRC
jgi:L-rhamnose isomerase